MRGLIVDELNHVLLALLQFPTRSVWVLPGGGIEADEEHHEALHRELREEVGLYSPPIGELLWTRTHVVPFIDGQWDGQRDHAYLVRTTRFDPGLRFADVRVAANARTSDASTCHSPSCWRAASRPERTYRYTVM